MLVSYVLRVVAKELAEDRLVGEVESVATGERATFRGPDELIRFCREQVGDVNDALPRQRPALRAALTPKDNR